MTARILLLASLTLLTLSACRQAPPITLSVPGDSRVLQGTWTGDAHSITTRSALTLTPDGQHLLSLRNAGPSALGPGSESRVVELRDARSGTLLAEHDVSALHVSAPPVVRGMQLLVPGREASVVLSLPDLREVRRLGAAVLATPEGDTLIARDADGTLRLTDVESGIVTMVSGLPNYFPKVPKVLPGRQVLVGHEIRQLPQNELVRTLKPSALTPCASTPASPADVAVGGPGGALAVIFENAEVQLRATDDALLASTRLFAGCGNGFRFRLHWNPSGELDIWWVSSVASGNNVPWDAEVRLSRWNPRTGILRDVSRWQGATDPRRTYPGLDFTPTAEGDLLVAHYADLLRVKPDKTVAWRFSPPAVPVTLVSTAHFEDKRQYTFQGTLTVGARMLNVSGSAMGSRVEFRPQGVPQMLMLQGEVRDGNTVVGRLDGRSGLGEAEQQLVITLEEERFEVTLRRP